jgi:deoxyribonuclease V
MSALSRTGITRAAVVVLRFPELELVETSVIRRPTAFPYIPGLLSFREAPAVLEAIDRLRALPDLLICDGQGLAHPRRVGLASHLGLWTGLPSIGAAKSRLIGQHEPVGEVRGDWQPLWDAGELIGAHCTRPGARPLYISIAIGSAWKPPFTWFCSVPRFTACPRQPARLIAWLHSGETFPV